MNKYEIVKNIELFAPVETAEPWDCVGFGVKTSREDVSTVMLCLTVTDDIVNQARDKGCQMIISHHPLFYVPTSWFDIDIYCAHTNLDKVQGGTTDTMIETLGLSDFVVDIEHEFLRFVEFSDGISVSDFSKKLLTISPDARIVNNKNIQTIKTIAFCAGSGSEFINEAKIFGADCLVTGDLKFHTALDSEIVVYDIGHFESEILILPILEKLVRNGIEVCYAKEKSPFTLIK